MFVDQIKVEVTAGRGGNGMCAYRREKYVEFGGPWGGSGGKGGDIIFIGDAGMTTLYPFRYMKHIKAKHGDDGRSKGMRGAVGDDLEIKVPLGTIVRKDDSSIIGEITTHDERLLIAVGGKGGRGNIALSSHTNPTPNFAERGDLGEHFVISLELQVLADVGFLGFPSVGKSSLVAAISNAKTKIADYPFTTLHPTLGMVQFDDANFAVADLPGLIEQAHLGVGLGTQFLKHLSRCRVYVHVLDPMRERLLKDYDALRYELSMYDHTLLDRKERIVINKAEVLDDTDRKKIQALFDEPVMFTSTITRENIESLIKMLATDIQTLPIIKRVEHYVKRVTLDTEKPIDIYQEEQTFYVKGTEVEKVYIRADFSNDEGIKRFLNQLRKLGIEEALRKKGATHGAYVRIFDYEFEFIDN
jgi:GTP-binding protein